MQFTTSIEEKKNLAISIEEAFDKTRHPFTIENKAMKGLRKFSQLSKGQLQNLTAIWRRWSSRKQNQRHPDDGGRGKTLYSWVTGSCMWKILKKFTKNH